MSQVRKQILTRSSLACLSCRSRHQKCDAKKPQCTRCTEADRPCQYTKSRRGANGGRDESLRRREPSISPNQLETCVNALITPPDIEAFATAIVSPDISIAQSLSNVPVSRSPPIDHRTERSRRSSASTRSLKIENSSLLEAYYQNFHKFHPLVLPCQHFVTLLEDPNWRPRLEPLAAIMKLIGNLYLCQKWSQALQKDAETRIEELATSDPIRVQCHLLYSVALFWQDRKDQSQAEMAKAVKLALELKMFEKEFSYVHGAQDMIVAECWRRTWWKVYIFDAFYAGTLGKMDFTVLRIDATVDLPCDEAEYETGVSLRCLSCYYYEGFDTNQRWTGYSRAEDITRVGE